MEADNIKQIAEMQTFNDYREPESHSAEDSNGSQFLNCPVSVYNYYFFCVLFIFKCQILFLMLKICIILWVS